MSTDKRDETGIVRKDPTDIAAISTVPSDRLAGIANTLDALAAGAGENPGIALPAATFGHSVTRALSHTHEDMAGRHLTNDLAREAMLGAYEDFIRQIAKDLGVKGEGQDALLAIRNAVIDNRIGRNGQDLWRAWMTPLADLLGLDHMPKPAHLGPFATAIKSLRSASTSTASEAAVLSRESEVLTVAGATLARAEATVAGLRALLADADARAVARATAAAEGADSADALVNEATRLHARAAKLLAGPAADPVDAQKLRALRRGLDALLATIEDIQPPAAVATIPNDMA